MTLVYKTKKKCAVCGKSNKYGHLASTNTIGSPDLDTRPSEMMRSTINYWVQRCPSCGYCAPDISKLLPKAEEIVRNDLYQKLLRDLLFSKVKEYRIRSEEKKKIQKYLEKSKEVMPLTSTEEKELAQRISKQDTKAKEKLIQANLALVISMAKDYINRSPTSNLLDLIQTGYSALTRAVEKFDWRKDYRFSTYATWWIRQAIQRKNLVYRHPPQLANAFICWSFIEEKAGNFKNAGWAALYAAWTCDDNGNKKGAQESRKKAVNLFQKAQSTGQTFAEDRETERIILIDLLRRSGQFRSALKICEEELKKKPKNLILKILEFQKKLINKSDTGCHKITEAI